MVYREVSTIWVRRCRLGLASLWLLDGVLQLQSFFFQRGSEGFSGMLAVQATGNPGWIYGSIHHNASLVYHHSALSNSLFALLQILLGIGIAWRPTLKPAIFISVVWSGLVWWFGEGLGGVLHQDGSPLGGGPGAVLFYALIGLLLWPRSQNGENEGLRAPFAGAKSFGPLSTKRIALIFWIGMAALMLGEGSSKNGPSAIISDQETGQPGWLTSLDRHVASGLYGKGLLVGIVVSVVFLFIAVAPFMPPRLWRATIVFASALFCFVWIVFQGFGDILGGGATDPNSAPLLVLLMVCFWPIATSGYENLDGEWVSASQTDLQIEVHA